MHGTLQESPVDFQRFLMYFMDRILVGAHRVLTNKILETCSKIKTSKFSYG